MLYVFLRAIFLLDKFSHPYYYTLRVKQFDFQSIFNPESYKTYKIKNKENQIC